MYWLFRYKNIMPSEFYNMKRGEKIICSVFMSEELEDRGKREENLASMFS